VLIVGLTGNYGMGKSTVLGMFGRLGAVTAGADRMVDALLGDPSVLDRMRNLLGEGVFSADGSLDRAKTAAIIFEDREKRNDVEDILHPLVFQKIDELLDQLQRDEAEGKVVIIEIPLLFEKDYGRRFHRTITVYADQETALARLEKHGIDRDKALVRIAAQMPIHEKIRMADFTVNNSDTEEKTEIQVREIYKELLAEAGRQESVS
jgi:dephospho-CoA kinase